MVISIILKRFPLCEHTGQEIYDSIYYRPQYEGWIICQYSHGHVYEPVTGSNEENASSGFSSNSKAKLKNYQKILKKYAISLADSNLLPHNITVLVSKELIYLRNQ